jgi:hypothetical protein
MKKAITLFVLSFFCEVHCGEYVKEWVVQDDRYVKLIREKTPGFVSKCDVEVSSCITRDAARSGAVIVLNGSVYLNASWRMFIDYARSLAKKAGVSFDPLADDVAQEPLRVARLICLEYGRCNCMRQSHLVSCFVRIGCFAYCGDEEALRILADTCHFRSQHEIARRAYLASSAE